MTSRGKGLSTSSTWRCLAHSTKSLITTLEFYLAWKMEDGRCIDNSVCGDKNFITKHWIFRFSFGTLIFHVTYKPCWCIFAHCLINPTPWSSFKISRNRYSKEIDFISVVKPISLLLMLLLLRQLSRNVSTNFELALNCYTKQLKCPSHMFQMMAADNTFFYLR